ncbi:MAG: hypothetical protein ACI4F8_05160 [Lachnospiraceae bacterium]
MRYFKKVNADGSLDHIGTEEVLTEGHMEIPKEEYDSLFLYIREHAEHIIITEEEAE